MDFLTAGIICIILLLALMALGLQIGLSFILSGLVVGSLLLSMDSALSLLGQAAYFSVASPTWTAIPLFILMGAFASNGGLARRAYDGVHAMTLAHSRIVVDRHLFQLWHLWRGLGIIHRHDRHFRQDGPPGNEPSGL